MKRIVFAGATALVIALGIASPAAALSSKECSAKFKAAKADGTIAGRKYADYRKTECGAGAGTVASTAPAETRPRAVPSAAPASSGALSYPSTISSRYATESAGKGRMHTCLDAYRAAKASGSLGGMRWIQKGGGYYSACNAHLKA